MARSDILKFNVSAIPYTNGQIEIQTTDLFGQISRQVIQSTDEVIKQALIQLGWTPPGETDKIKAEAVLEAKSRLVTYLNESGHVDRGAIISWLNDHAAHVERGGQWK